MATRTQFESSNEIGVFSVLTNSYALCAIGGSENFYSSFETELADHIPVVHCSIAGCRFIGRVTAGGRTRRIAFGVQSDVPLYNAGAVAVMERGRTPNLAAIGCTPPPPQHAFSIAQTLAFSR